MDLLAKVTLTVLSALSAASLLNGCSTQKADLRNTRLPAAASVPIVVLGGDEASFTPQLTREIVDDQAHYDVIIVGGGLAGLTAGVYLSDKNLRVLMLEKESHWGGLAAPGSTEDGIAYDRGAAYWTSDFAEEHVILKHIGLGRYEKKFPIPEPIDSFYWNGKLYVGIWDEKTLQELPPSFALFKSELEHANEAGLIPNQPMEEFGALGGKMDLDRLNTTQWINSMPDLAKTRQDPKSVQIYARYLQENQSTHANMNAVLDLMDLYCRSALGTHPDQVSAMAFANFYISEIVTRYTTPIGTGKAAANMTKTLKHRRRVTMINSAPVGKITPLKDFTEVTYLTQNTDGTQTSHRAKAKYVVFAAQLKIAPQLIEGFATASPKQAQLMTDMGYAHYSVHNIEVQGHPYRNSYDTWNRPVGYTENDFTDFILGRWEELKGYEGFRDFSKDPVGNSVITIYDPLALKWIGSGYTKEQAAQIAERAANRFVELYQPVLNNLAPQGSLKTEIKMLSIKTSRWPFSVHIAKPGHFIDEARVLRKNFGNIFFAHNNLGTPAFEEALFRGRCAAINILLRAKSHYKKDPASLCPIEGK